MLIFTAEGPRSIDDHDVIAVYRVHTLGGYCPCTLVLNTGAEVTGMALSPALDKLERSLLPPAAA